MVNLVPRVLKVFLAQLVSPGSKGDFVSTDEVNHATHGSSNLFCLVTALAGLADIFFCSVAESSRKRKNLEASEQQSVGAKVR